MSRLTMFVGLPLSKVAYAKAETVTKYNEDTGEPYKKQTGNFFFALGDREFEEYEDVIIFLNSKGLEVFRREKTGFSEDYIGKITQRIYETEVTGSNPSQYELDFKKIAQVTSTLHHIFTILGIHISKIPVYLVLESSPQNQL